MTILIMRQGQTQTISLNEIEHFQFKAGDQLWIDRSPGQGAEEIRIEGNSLVLADGTTIRLLGALSKLISSGQVNLYLDDVSTHLSAEKSHNTNEHSDSVQANNNDSTDKSAENAHAKTTAPLTIEQSIALLESNPTASGDFAFVNASGVSNSGQQISISNAQNSTQEISLVSTNQPSSSGGSVASSVFTISSGQSDPSLSSAPVDTTAPAAPIITAISDNVGVVDGISLATPTLVTDNSTTNDSTPSLSGKAEPGSTVTIIDTKDDGTKIVLGTAVTAANGDWTFTPGTGTGASTPLSSGAHHITVTSTDPTGNVSAASSALTFTVDTAAPSAPVLSRV
ncbi:MAG: Ig-like domain-containing protein, partial [Pseudomonadota bacterium]